MPFMCPTDPTPDPRDMERMPESQTIPQGRSSPKADDARDRPPLPERPVRMPADEDNEDRE